MRVAFVPRSAEIQPLFWRFVTFLTTPPSDTFINKGNISRPAAVSACYYYCSSVSLSHLSLYCLSRPVTNKMGEFRDFGAMPNMQAR